MNEQERKEYAERLKVWTKFLKKDRDFDGYYIIRTLKFKIEQVRNSIRDYGHHKNKELDGAEMQEVIDLLGAYLADNYDEPFRKAHQKKWGKPVYKYIPVDIKGNTVPAKNAKFFRVETSRPKAKTKAQIKEATQELIEGSRQAEALKQIDLVKAMALIAQNVEKWWD